MPFVFTNSDLYSKFTNTLIIYFFNQLVFDLAFNLLRLVDVRACSLLTKATRRTKIGRPRACWGARLHCPPELFWEPGKSEDHVVYLMAELVCNIT